MKIKMINEEFNKYLLILRYVCVIISLVFALYYLYNIYYVLRVSESLLVME